MHMAGYLKNGRSVSRIYFGPRGFPTSVLLAIVDPSIARVLGAFGYVWNSGFRGCGSQGFDLRAWRFKGPGFRFWALGVTATED